MQKSDLCCKNCSVQTRKLSVGCILPPPPLQVWDTVNSKYKDIIYQILDMPLLCHCNKNNTYINYFLHDSLCEVRMAETPTTGLIAASI